MQNTGDLGLSTLSLPRFRSSYVLPQLWDPGGVNHLTTTPRMSYNLPRRSITSRYPYATCMSNLNRLASQ